MNPCLYLFWFILWAVTWLCGFGLGRLSVRKERRKPTPMQRAYVASWAASVRRAHSQGMSEGWSMANAPKHETGNN